MKGNLQIHRHIPKKSQTPLKALSIRRTAEFFVGWMKRFGTTMILFAFPLNRKEHPYL